MWELLLRNHVLANLTFVLVLVVGALSYFMLPRQQDPTINFNWIVITTVLPGAAAQDVEKKITDPLEDAIRKIQNIDFISSNSRESVSSILVRFEDINERIFDKRISDLRREIQNKQDELPDAADDPLILEITSSNAFPSASVAVVGMADDENLRVQARNIEKDIERLKGVDRVDPIGLRDPELRVSFDPEALEARALSPGQIADTVTAFFQDIAAGDARLGDENWLVRIVGSDSEPTFLASRPIINTDGEVTLGEVALVERARQEADTLTRYDGHPAVLLAVMKQADTNTLELVDRVNAYLDSRNAFSGQTGVRLVLTDDQTIPTRESIGLMQKNALIGLFLVLIVAWLFLGSRIAFLTAIGIPFILAGTFWSLMVIGETLNVTVLLGVVIVLGMLVDDAVVVVEAIYYRLRLGTDAVTAALESLREVARPVTSAVLTTMAAFLPLMLLPGILGDFMRVIPMVVSIALAISLVEAFWMLPTHVVAANVSFAKPSRIHKYRIRFTHKIRIIYVRVLIRAMRHRWLSLSLVVLLFLSSIGVVSSGLVRMDFFAADPLRIYYVNIEMPPSSPINKTMEKVLQVEAKVKSHLREGEARAVISYAGNMFTEMEPLLGDHYGQILIGLNPKTPELRDVDEMIESMREDVIDTPGPMQISFLRISGGPPTALPISVKVRGDRYSEIRSAADTIREILGGIEGVKDIKDDASRGRSEMILTLNEERVQRAGVNPMEINRTIQLLVDGQIVADMRDAGEKLEVRVKSEGQLENRITDLLNFRYPLPDGSSVPLSELVKETRSQALGNIRHYNFRRAITVEADIDDQVIDTLTANSLLLEGWQARKGEFPDIDLDFSGELDDIYEAMDSIGVLFIFGVGLMYLILGTQFRSYWQPFMILATVPMAFTGVVYGMFLTNNPLSLYTLYGVVALAGIAVNAAIVLISAANARLESGMSVLHATLYAARRRVVPILITSLTTVAGLFSLATGLGGKSLIWGPVATAIVWGLAFSTVLTLIVVPLLYRIFMEWSHRVREVTADETL